MFMKTILLVFLQFIIMSSTQNSSDEVIYNQIIVPRVVNGIPAKYDDVPYQISFKRKTSYFGSEYMSFCGGTLIMPKKILTAAHCFEEKMLCKPCGSVIYISEKKRKKLMAVAGNLHNKAKYHLFSKDIGQWRKLRKVMYPRNYRFPTDDIALAFTESQFTLNSNVATIPYATRHNDYKGKCRISGFGRTSATKTSAILLYADVEVISSRKCTKMHYRRMSKFICTSDVISDVHKGDSGGPLVCKNTGDPAESNMGVVVGIVSGNRPTVGSFFTRVSAYKDFIESKNVMVTGKHAFLITILLNIETLLF